MGIEEYIKSLDKIKTQAVDRWGNLTSIERSVFDGAYDWLIDNLEIKRGVPVVDEDLVQSMDRFLREIVSQVVNNKSYRSKLNTFLADLTTIQSNNKKFHADTHNFDIDTAGVNDVQKAVVGKIIDQYIGNGLNPGFAAPIADGVFRTILAGANMKEVRQVMQDDILGGKDTTGKMGRYLNQNAMMAVDTYTGAINQQLMTEFQFTGMIISGSLIKTSSTQCRYAVDNADQTFGYLSFKQWEEVLEIARNNPQAKLIEGTTVKNLPLNKLHWGCRHDFTPTIMVVPGADKPLKKDPPPADPVKPKKEPKPKSPKKPAAVPGKYREATTLADAKRNSKEIIEANTGFKVDKTSFGKMVRLEDQNLLNKQLEALTTEYQISSGVNKSFGIKVSFKGSSSYAGVVKSIPSQGRIVEVDFGIPRSTARVRDFEASEIFSRKQFSSVDAENEKLSTATHEFMHLISVVQMEPRLNSEQKPFWTEVAALRSDYSKELAKLQGPTGDDQELKKIFLGRYASTNVNEFAAEAFTEYKLKKEPSPYAKKLGLLVDKYFKK